MKINVLVLLWHSTINSSVTAGGIRRIIEFVKRIPDDINLYILDNFPTVFDFQSPRHNVYQYKIPNIVYRLLSHNFVLGRLLEWVIASLKLFFNGNKILKQKNCQVIYVPTSELLFLFLPAILLKIIHRKQIVCDILNFEMTYGSISRFYRQMRSKSYSFGRSLFLPVYIRFQINVIKSFFGRIDCIMTVSRYLADFIRKLGANCYIGFTPSGVDYRFIDSISANSQIFDCVFVGRHEAEKGVFDLIQVWRYVLELRPNSRLVMAGPCNTDTRQQINKKLNEFQISDYVSIKGVLSEEEKIRIIKASKVFIHLGHIEPLVPVITVLEGLACGLPVVLYDQPSYKEHPEIYQHPSFALVPLRDHKAAAKKIISFIDMDGSLRNIVSQRAKKYARGYDWDNISQIEYGVIRQMV